MELDVFHQWWLLRPLFIFALATPAFLLALLVSRIKERREAKRQRENELTAPKGEEKPVSDRGYEAPWSATQTPRGWDGGPPSPEGRRRVA